jgi:hypothetical protein
MHTRACRSLTAALIAVSMLCAPRAFALVTGSNRALNGCESAAASLARCFGAVSSRMILTVTSRFTGLTSGGVTAHDWLSAAVSDPDGVVDCVEEGTLVSTLGVNAFTCPVE